MKLQTDTPQYYDYYAVFDYCRRLIYSSLYNPEERAKFDAQLENMDLEALEMFIRHLLDNQIDAIDAGHAYNQGDILRKINKET